MTCALDRQPQPPSACRPALPRLLIAGLGTHRRPGLLETLIPIDAEAPEGEISEGAGRMHRGCTQAGVGPALCPAPPGSHRALGRTFKVLGGTSLGFVINRWINRQGLPEACTSRSASGPD